MAVGVASQKNYISIYGLRKQVAESGVTLAGAKEGKGCINFTKPESIDLEADREAAHREAKGGDGHELTKSNAQPLRQRQCRPSYTTMLSSRPGTKMIFFGSPVTNRAMPASARASAIASSSAMSRAT